LIDEVVSEIQKKGGKSMANYDSVEQGDLIIQKIIKEYGKIDILINNAYDYFFLKWKWNSKR
jgi:NADP-dependent 3-hydroxy acid dehydrogenase YdfG